MGRQVPINPSDPDFEKIMRNRINRSTFMWHVCMAISGFTLMVIYIMGRF